MPICSYLVIPEKGAADRVEDRLTLLQGCQVTPAENGDVLLLVTETPDLEEEEALRGKVEALDGIQALLFTFGEVDPDTELGDPITVGTKKGEKGDGPRRRSLPVVPDGGER